MSAEPRVTRADIEGKLRQLGDRLDDATETAKPGLVGIGVAGGVVTVLLAYILGRRRGRRRSTVVEVRRI